MSAEAEEFFRKELIKRTDSKTMKKINAVVNLEKQGEICEAYLKSRVEAEILKVKSETFPERRRGLRILKIITLEQLLKK